MSQNLHINFIKFLKKLEYLGHCKKILEQSLFLGKIKYTVNSTVITVSPP